MTKSINGRPGEHAALASALFDSAYQYNCLLTADGRLVDANTNCLAFGGLDAEAQRGKLIWRAQWWPDWQKARDTLVRAISEALNGAVPRFTADWTGSAGETISLDFSLQAIKSGNGAPVQLLLEGKNITARCRAEKAATATSALLQDFFTSSPTGMVILDRQLRHQFVNETLATITGHSIDEHIGKTLWEIVPSVAPSMVPVLEEILLSGQPQLNILVSGEVRSQPGVIRHWRTSHFPIRDHLGDIQGVGGVIVEVTEQIRAEEALQNQRAMIDAFFDAAPVGMVILDRNLRNLHINKRLAAAHLLPVSDHIGRTLDDVIPDLAVEAGNIYRQVLASNKPLNNLRMSACFPDQPETQRVGSVSVFPIADQQTEAAFLGCVVVDVTEQDRAENEIRKQANELMELYQNAPCGYHSLDSKGRIVRINDTELAWLGYERSDILDKPLTDFLTPDSRRQFERTFPLLRSHGSIRDIEQEMICKDGRILPVLLNSTVIFDDAGRFIMTRATITDMTERNRAAEERQKQEARRMELSQHLIEIQEEERRRLAQELHDVVSPNIAAIQINLGIVELGLSHETLKHVGARLADIRQLIQDTNRNLRAICANLRPSLLDYAGLYAAVENYARQFSERTGIRVEVTGGDLEEGRLPGNVEVLLFRIVQEALVNCGKHAQASEVSIELSFDSQHAFLEISDNGVGFDKNELTAAGTRPGLGLLTMAERAELAGGRFQLESKPGQGTRITLEI